MLDLKVCLYYTYFVFNKQALWGQTLIFSMYMNSNAEINLFRIGMIWE